MSQSKTYLVQTCSKHWATWWVKAIMVEKERCNWPPLLVTQWEETHSLLTRLWVSKDSEMINGLMNVLGLYGIKLGPLQLSGVTSDIKSKLKTDSCLSGLVTCCACWYNAPPNQSSFSLNITFEKKRWGTGYRAPLDFWIYLAIIMPFTVWYRIGQKQ